VTQPPVAVVVQSSGAAPGSLPVVAAAAATIAAAGAVVAVSYGQVPTASAGLVFAVGFDVIPIPVLVAAAVALLTSEAAAAATAAHAHVVAAVAGTARSHLLRINMRHNHLLSYLLGRELTLLLMPLLMLELFLRLFMVDWRRLLLWLNSWTSCSCCCHSVSRRRTLTCHGVTQTLRKNLADAGPNHLGIHISFGGGVS
jgi:hypothetical protein